MNPELDDPIATGETLDPNEVVLSMRVDGRVVSLTRAYVLAVERGHLASPNLYLSLAPRERRLLEVLFLPRYRRSA